MKIKILHRRVLLLVGFFLFCAIGTVNGQVKIADSRIVGPKLDADVLTSLGIA